MWTGPEKFLQGPSTRVSFSDIRVYGSCPRAQVHSTVNTKRLDGMGSRVQRKGKEKNEYLYSAIYTTHSLIALRHGSYSFTRKLHHACLYISPRSRAVSEISQRFHRARPHGYCVSTLSTSSTSWCSALASPSLTPLVTSVLSSIVSSRVQDRRARTSVARWCCPRVSC